MPDSRDGQSTPAQAQRENRPRALKDLQFNSLLAADNGASSEDEVAEGQELLAEDAHGAIGISIGYEQARLTSPKTPAVEKAAAIDQAGGFFDGAWDPVNGTVSEEPDELEERDISPTKTRHEDNEEPSTDLPQRSPRRSSVRLPSPWRAESKRSRHTKSLLRDGLLFSRKRASSGPETSWHRNLMSSLPSMPKNFSFTSALSGLHDRHDEQETDANRKKLQRSSWQWSGFGAGNVRKLSDMSSHDRSGSGERGSLPTNASSLREQEEAEATIGDLPDRPSMRKTHSRPLQLRRSTSDTSLVTHRTLSRVSSLGDDTRFVNVQEQVNSRLKAIKDTWQDSWQESSIRLPTLPSISNFKPDFLRDRAGSFDRKQQEHHDKSEDPLTMRPYHTAKAAFADAGPSKPSSHPNLSRALEQLEGDILVMGGYRGSILRSAEPPHRQLWVPIKVGLNIRKVDLEVGIGEDDDERAAEKIIPGGMLSHIGPIDISRRLFRRLRNCENARLGKLRVHDYGYDWRLHPAHLSKQLISFLENLPCNQPDTPKEQRGATIIAHSLGGLITRHAINQRPDLVKGVVYAGVPNTCVNILGPLRNGDDVLLSQRVLTAQVNFTVRTSFALLPLDGRCFFDKETKEEYPVDFFDPKTWIECRLSPCIARPLPPLSAPLKPTGLAGYVSSMTNALPSLSLPGRKGSVKSTAVRDATDATATEAVSEPGTLAFSAGSRDCTMASGNIDESGQDTEPSADTTSSIKTTVTIPREEAIAYLTRTLATVKKFKQELAFVPAHAAANKYPPIAVIYGKSTPTVYGAKVNGREGIKHADAYDELAFASGDGVVLARASMVPEGYTAVRGGVVSSERGHVTLLGDLEAAGKCLNAIIAAQKRGVGCGT